MIQVNIVCRTFSRAIFHSFKGVVLWVPTQALSILPDVAHLPYSAHTLSNLSHHPPHTTRFTQSTSYLGNTNTRPNHLNIYLLTTSVTILSLNSILDALSLSDTLHIHCTILISVRSNRSICPAFMAQVSLPYTFALLTYLTYTFLFN